MLHWSPEILLTGSFATFFVISNSSNQPHCHIVISFALATSDALVAHSQKIAALIVQVRTDGEGGVVVDDENHIILAVQPLHIPWHNINSSCGNNVPDSN